MRSLSRENTCTTKPCKNQRWSTEPFGLLAIVYLFSECERGGTSMRALRFQGWQQTVILLRN